MTAAGLVCNVAKDARIAREGRPHLLGQPVPIQLHSQLQQEEREAAIATLHAQPDALVVATDVAARGLDIPDLV